MRHFIAGLACLLAFSTSAFAGEFPVTVKHGYGETTVPAAPKRVVSVGFVEQDFLYSLGIAPVGVRAWWGDHPYATWAWAEPARAALNAEPVVLPAEELNLELILQQDPDLIVATFVEFSQEEYDALSKIAPVVYVPAGFAAWSAPWQEQLRIIDRATAGDTVKSDAIVADIEASLAKVRETYPQFAGKTGTNTYYADGGFIAWGPEDGASRFLISLGLSFPTALEGMVGDSNQIDVSTENLRLLDLDVAVWPLSQGDESRKTVEAMPLYQNLRLAKEQRSVWLDDGTGTLTAALTYQTPLAIAYLIDRLPPLIAAAIDGDPTTSAEVTKP